MEQRVDTHEMCRQVKRLSDVLPLTVVFSKLLLSQYEIRSNILRMSQIIHASLDGLAWRLGRWCVVCCLAINGGVEQQVWEAEYCACTAAAHAVGFHFFVYSGKPIWSLQEWQVIAALPIQNWRLALAMQLSSMVRPFQQLPVP